MLVAILAQRGLPAIATEVFPRNNSDWTQFSKFHHKRALTNNEAIGNPRLGMEKRIFYCCTIANILALNVHSHYTK